MAENRIKIKWYIISVNNEDHDQSFVEKRADLNIPSYTEFRRHNTFLLCSAEFQ